MAVSTLSLLLVTGVLSEVVQRRAYDPPVHTISLHSVYDYSKASDTLYDEPTSYLAVSADGAVQNMRTDAPIAKQSLAQTNSVVHATQLERLRPHQKEIAALRTAEDTAKQELKATLQSEGHSAEHIKVKMQEHSTRARRSWQVSVNGVIPLKNLRDSQYVGPVGVGTNKDGSPESEINVVFDTGSTNLWIASTLCQSDDCSARARYNKDASSTATDPSEPVHLDITFGTGELRGPQGIDDFHVGPYTVKAQTFGMIEDEVGEVFHEIPFEGILGLAFPSMSARGVQPFFDTVMEQNVLHGHNEISFYMTRMPDTTSAVFFGGVDDRFFSGNIVYFPVVQEHYWSCDLIDFRIGDKSHVDFMEMGGDLPVSDVETNDSGSDSLIEFRSTQERVGKLILDTGTTYFTAPPGLFQKIMDRLPYASCAGVAKYPDLHYIMKDTEGQVHDIAIPPSTYMVSSYGDNWCDLSFMEIPVPDEYGPAFLMGEVFMREWYTVFSRGSGSPGSASIGFAKANAPSSDVTDKVKAENSVSYKKSASMEEEDTY